MLLEELLSYNSFLDKRYLRGTTMTSQSLFGKKLKDKRLAEIISIESPEAFKNSIKQLGADGLSERERNALVFSQNRAGAQLRRKNLSPKERVEFEQIVNIAIPEVDGLFDL